MIADPIAEAERVYAEFGLHLTAKAKNAMPDYLKIDRPGQGPEQSYTLADYGLDERVIEEYLGKYLDDYRVTRER